MNTSTKPPLVDAKADPKSLSGMTIMEMKASIPEKLKASIASLSQAMNCLKHAGLVEVSHGDNKWRFIEKA